MQRDIFVYRYYSFCIYSFARIVLNYKTIIVSGESMRPKYSDGQIVFLVVSDCPVDCPFGLEKFNQTRLCPCW